MKDRIRIDGTTPAMRNSGEEFSRWKTDSSDTNMDVLLKGLKPTIDSALMSFGGGDQRLRVRANILAAQAIKSYNPGKAALKTHVFNNLKGLRRAKTQRDQAVHIPENVVLDENALRKFEAEFEEDRGRAPTDDETRDALGMSRKRLLKARGRFSETPQASLLSDKGDELAQVQRDPYYIWMDYVYHDLGTVDKKIFEWTTGYDGNKVLPKTEIAKRLRITPAAVSMRITKMMSKLQEVQQ